MVADEKEVVDRIREAKTLQDEPEVICDEAILVGWEEVAALHRSRQHADDVAAARVLRPMLATEDRIKDIERRAKHANFNLTRECYIMRCDLRRARAGNRKEPPRLLARLERLEATLDGLS